MILGIFATQMLDGERILGAVFDDSCIEATENIGEAVPVFIAVIEHERDRGVLGNVLHALDLGSAFPLGLFIYHKTKPRAVEPEAQRNIVRLSGAAHGREMTDCGLDEVAQGQPFESIVQGTLSITTPPSSESLISNVHSGPAGDLIDGHREHRLDESSLHPHEGILKKYPLEPTTRLLGEDYRGFGAGAAASARAVAEDGAPLRILGISQKKHWWLPRFLSSDTANQARK